MKWKQPLLNAKKKLSDDIIRLYAIWFSTSRFVDVDVYDNSIIKERGHPDESYMNRQFTLKRPGDITVARYES